MVVVTMQEGTALLTKVGTTKIVQRMIITASVIE